MKEVKSLIRVRLAKNIICEVAFLERQQGKVAIVCGGAPGTPTKDEVLRFLASKGYTAILMRYRGTWESEGSFLRVSPDQDVADVIEELVRKKSITDLETGQRLPLKVKHIDLFGGSFGGPAVLLNSKNKHVRKVVAFAPTVDWHGRSIESVEVFKKFTQEAFGGAYRPEKKSDWAKLLRKDFYNPITMTDKIDPKKCFIIQTEDDLVCMPENTRRFLNLVPCQAYFKPKGGHIGVSKIYRQFYWNKIQNFLKK